MTKGKAGTSSPSPRKGRSKLDAIPGSASPLSPSLVRNTDDGATPLRSLLPHHREQLKDDSGISDAVIQERDYFSVTDSKDLAKYGFAHWQRRVPCLVIPVRDVRGDIVNHQIRPDAPRVAKGKLLKYEWPKDSCVVLDIPKRCQQALGNPAVPLWVTEGAKKADSAASRGLCCIALAGVWSWRGSNEDGGKTTLPDWDSIALNEREVIIAFDSDVTEKPEVLAALTRFRAMLQSRGAVVRICCLPPGENGKKTGLDDYFAHGGTVDEIVEFIDDDLPENEAITEERGPYFIRNHCLYLNTADRNGDAVVLKVANFDARIVEEIRRDDGAEVTLQFRIQVNLNGKRREAVVLAEDFRDHQWIHGQIGSEAIVEVGHSPQRMCHAIQTMSDPKVCVVYCHTGWRRIGDTWAFLHAGGAIGPVGPIGPLATTGIDLPEPLRSVCFPSPPTGIERIEAVRASLSFIQVAPPHISWVLLLAAYRAALGDAGFSVFVVGLTGTRKTSTSAVAQQHFGAGFSLTNLPGNWSSTANATEELLFSAKDVLFVLDDFVPPAGTDRAKHDAGADRVIRNTANRSGRQRMRPDGSLRPNRPPRGMLLSTGEVLPRGHSLLARVVIVEFSAGDVDLTQLTRLQDLGTRGVLAKAMAAFLQWLSPRLEQARTKIKDCMRDYRSLIHLEQVHGRTVDAVAELFFTLDLFLTFAVDVEAVDQAQADAMRIAARQALLSTAGEQVVQQAEEDVADAFLRQVLGALTAGRCHLADATGSGSCAPQGYEDRCGWRRHVTENKPTSPSNSFSTWIPQGERIGWIDGEDIYLLPDVSESVALRLARERGEPINITGRALRKRLQQAGHLVQHGRCEGDKRLLARRTIAGARQDLLHLTAGCLFGVGVDQLDQLDQPAHLDEEPVATDPGRASVPSTEPNGAATIPMGNYDWSVSPHSPPRPMTACWICRSSTYQRTATGPWVCGTCHPIPSTLLVEEVDVAARTGGGA